jgi:hypothetical protein
LIEELRRITELVGKMPEDDQRALARAFLVVLNTYLEGRRNNVKWIEEIVDTALDTGGLHAETAPPRNQGEQGTN